MSENQEWYVGFSFLDYMMIGGDIYGDGPIYFYDQEGILKRGEVEEVLTRLNAFYARITDSEIDEANQQRAEKRKRDNEIWKQQQLSRERKGFVYLIRNRDTGTYKIGISKNVDRRLRTLNSAAGGGLELIHTIESTDMRRTERELHERYALAQLHNEWFALEDEDVEKIQSLMGVGYGEVQS
jgi:predicted GIY-YIG superfamily endonuclease